MYKYKLPIEITKIKSKSHDLKQETKFLITLFDKYSYWNKSIVVEREEILSLKIRLESMLNELSTSEILKIPEDKANEIDDAYKKDSLCRNCTLKYTQNCITCLFTLESPLERKLFLALKNQNIKFQPQIAIDWSGNIIYDYTRETHGFKNILTVVDFFFQKRNLTLCVYTDGHTYHERTEEQAQRDRNIDRKLQSLGYTVLRYTGKEINENINKITQEIQSWINNN